MQYRTYTIYPLALFTMLTNGSIPIVTLGLVLNTSILWCVLLMWSILQRKRQTRLRFISQNGGFLSLCGVTVDKVSD